jgi:heme/copper-type cytochrome/quinol oxidase subunit 2
MCAWCGGACLEFASATVPCQALAIGECNAASVAATMTMTTTTTSIDAATSPQSAFVDSWLFPATLVVVACCIVLLCCLVVVVVVRKNKNDDDDGGGEFGEDDVPDSWFFKGLLLV